MKIKVWNCRAAISRRVDLANGGWTYEAAENWEDLEAAAIEAIEAAGGAVNMSGLYPCPPELAERACWKEQA